MEISFNEKIEKSKEVIRKTLKQFPHENVVVAWTGGKDSTVLLHLVKETCGGSIPFPVMFNDSTMEFEEIYTFIRTITEKWKLKLIVVPHDGDELDNFRRTRSLRKKKELSRIMKVHAIETALKKYPIRAFIAGIRWDEHESRSHEDYFSQRKNHMRIHPILHFTEKDIWKYIKTRKVPYVSLYDKGYRSLGEKPFTKKAVKGRGERSGREKDKENLMMRLRNIGYW